MYSNELIGGGGPASTGLDFENEVKWARCVEVDLFRGGGFGLGCARAAASKNTNEASF